MARIQRLLFFCNTGAQENDPGIRSHLLFDHASVGDHGRNHRSQIRNQLRIIFFDQSVHARAAGADDILGLFRKIQEEHKKAAKEPEGDTQTAESSEKTAKEENPVNVLVDITKLFVFRNLDEVTRLAHILNGFYAGENDLYKSQTANRYYLLVSKSDQSPETFNKVCNILSEYAAQQPYMPATGAFFREHYHMILQGNALQTLAEL